MDGSADIEGELLRREPLFHHRVLGTSRVDFLRQTSDDFWEVGASGRRYGREEVWAVLERRFESDDEEPWEISEFRVRRLANNVYLATYRLLQAGSRVTRRATLWERSGDEWCAIYHQGTLE